MKQVHTSSTNRKVRESNLFITTKSQSEPLATQQDLIWRHSVRLANSTSTVATCATSHKGHQRPLQRKNPDILAGTSSGSAHATYLIGLSGGTIRSEVHLIPPAFWSGILCCVPDLCILALASLGFCFGTIKEIIYIYKFYSFFHCGISF